jgi:hypothetical protein
MEKAGNYGGGLKKGTLNRSSRNGKGAGKANPLVGRNEDDSMNLSWFHIIIIISYLYVSVLISCRVLQYKDVSAHFLLGVPGNL